MKRLAVFIFGILVCLVAGALAQGPGNLNAGSQLAATGSTGAYTFSWWGAAGNTYLMETSDDLINWTYLPVVESGTGAAIQWGFTSNASSLFMKLEYITLPVDQLSGAVFNGPDNNGNGLPDDWELFYFGYLGVDPAMDPTGEGFTNLQDYQNGNNPIATQVVSVGPTVGEYLFHETSGTVAHDISSLHNNGTLSGGAGWTGTGGYDGQGSITFDGTSGEVLISNTTNQALPVAGSPFSFAFWFQANAGLTGMTTLITDAVPGASGFEFGIDSTTSPPSLLFSTGTGGIQFETPFQPGTWTQAAVTYDGTTATIYVNGNASASGTGALLSNTSAIILANGLNGTNAFAGSIENLTLYQAVLQPSDISSLFNLSTTATGPDPSGIANWWKYQYFGALNVNPSAFVAWSGSQLTLLQAYQQGLNPIDFYNGQTPVLTIVSGSGQTGSPGGFVPAPLVVAVTDSNGNPLISAPVSFATVSGSMQLSSTAASVTTEALLTDGNGEARVYYQLPPAISNTSYVTATAGPALSATQITFAEVSDNGSGTYASPFAPSNVSDFMNSDGSETLTWTNNDNSSPIYIYELESSGSSNVTPLASGGSWSTIATLQPGSTTYTTPGVPAGPLQVGNNFSPGGSGGGGGGGGGGSGGGGGGDPGSSPGGQFQIQVGSGTSTSNPTASIVSSTGAILNNGDFSTPQLPATSGTWAVPAAAGKWSCLAPDYSGASQVEVQDIASPAYGGQYCEMNADWADDTSGTTWQQHVINGEGCAHGIQQTVSLNPGAYLLLFDYCGRAGTTFTSPNGQQGTQGVGNTLQVYMTSTTGTTSILNLSGISTDAWTRETIPITIGGDPQRSYPVTLVFDKGATEAADGIGAHVGNVVLVPVQFKVTYWNPVFTVPGITYLYNQSGSSVIAANIAVSSTETLQLSATTQISIPLESGTLADSLASQWDLIVYQNLVEQGADRIQYSNESTVYAATPIPGEDVGGDPGEPTEIPQKQPFSSNNQSLSSTFNDSPSDTFISRWYNSDIPQDPLKFVQREGQFVTWIYAQNRVTNQVCYLKWIKWQVSYSVNFDFTKAVPDTRNTWIFQKLSEGDGIGPLAPIHTPFSLSPKTEKNP